jgi:hypothetical protein
VIETFRDQPMRPKLQIEYDSQGRKVLTERIVSLPENSLLYIVDSVSEEEIEQLERGVPLKKRQDPFEAQDAQPGDGVSTVADPEKPETFVSPSPGGTARTRRGGGGRYLMALLILSLFLGGFLFLRGMAPARSSSTETVETTPAHRVEAAPEADEKNNTVATARESKRISPPLPDQTPESGARIREIEPAPPSGPQRRQDAVDRQTENGANLIASAATEAVKHPATVVRAVDPGAAPSEPSGEKSAETPLAAGELKELEIDGTGRFPYALLLSSFRAPARAERALAIYREKGIAAYPVEVDLGENGTWYRVFTGHFSNEADAASAAEMLPVEGAAVKKTRYANRIGADLPASEAREQALHLESLGFFPYTIPTAEGRADLFVGAFLTQKGAEDQHARLRAGGVQNRIVER